MPRTIKVLALSMGRGLTSLVSLLSLAVLSHLLTKTEYATFRQTFLAYNFAAPLMSLGLVQAMYYFLPGETDRIRGRVADGICLLLIMGSVFSLFILLGGNHLLARRFSNPHLSDSLLYLTPYPIFMLPASILSVVLVVRERFALLTTFNVLSRFAIGFAIILPCVFFRTASASILGQVGMTVVTGCIAVYLMFRSTPPDSWRPYWESMKSMVKFSVPLAMASMIGMISLQLDKMVVASMCSPEGFAVYANGAFEIPLIGIITGSVSAVILADMRKMVVAGNNDDALRLFRKAAEKTAWILLPAMFFLFISADSLILVLFSSKYEGSVLPFKIYLLTLPVRIIFYGPMLIAIGKTNVILHRAIVGLLINLILSIFLVKVMGYIGAALSTLIVLYIWSVPFNLFHITRYFNISIRILIPFDTILKILFCMILPTSLSFIIDICLATEIPVFRIILIALVFALPLSFFWNGEIYSYRRLMGRVKSYFIK